MKPMSADVCDYPLHRAQGEALAMTKMTNEEYTKAVDTGGYPLDPMVRFNQPFVNQNGSIKNLLLVEKGFSSVAVINSVQGSVRANHYHKTDWHYAYIIKGTIRYYWRAVGLKQPPFEWVFVAGEMFFTPPMVEHAMYFEEDTQFITFAKNIRDHDNHESDLVRVPFVEAEWTGLHWTSKFVGELEK